MTFCHDLTVRYFRTVDFIWPNYGQTQTLRFIRKHDHRSVTLCHHFSCPIFWNNSTAYNMFLTKARERERISSILIKHIMLENLASLFGRTPTQEQILAKEAELLNTISELVVDNQVSISKFGEINVGQHVDFDHHIHPEDLGNNPDLKYVILAKIVPEKYKQPKTGRIK